MTKSPGLSTEPVGVELDLTYKQKFQAQAEKARFFTIYPFRCAPAVAPPHPDAPPPLPSARQGLPDAYERLILDALNGDSSLFVRDDEVRPKSARGRVPRAAAAQRRAER